MTSRIAILFFAVVFAAFLVASVPLALFVSGSDGIAPSQVQGTIWRGALRGSTQGYPYRLDLEGKLSSLLTAGYAGDWQLVSAAVNGQGSLSTGLFAPMRIYDAEATMDIRSLSLPQGLVGSLQIVIEDMELASNGTCRHATGRVSTDTLVASGEQLNWQGPVLAGPVICENGNMVLAMAGNADGTEIALRTLLTPVGTYNAVATVTTGNPVIGVLLAGYGFVPEGNVYRLQRDGRWR